MTCAQPLTLETPTRPTKLAGVSNDGTKSESPRTENGERQAPSEFLSLATSFETFGARAAIGTNHQSLITSRCLQKHSPQDCSDDHQTPRSDLPELQTGKEQEREGKSFC